MEQDPPVKKIAEADAELIALMLKGNEAAFRRFFETYFPRLYRFAAPRLDGDPDATKEVVQSTLIKAMRNLGNYRGEAAIFSWLCQICRRQIIDHVRAHRRHLSRLALVEDNDEMQRVLEAIAAPCADEPLHCYGADETRRIVQSVLDRLPDRYGDVLEWKYIEGRSVEEIAELLGVGQIAVQSMLARARVAFRSALETVFGMATSDLLSGMRGH
jgi:RNA polymerase sigma-70 factor (ECF subfamily)